MLEDFDQVFAQATDAGTAPLARTLRRKKTVAQKIAFWGANCVVMPLVSLCYLTISADGLRQMLPLLSLRIYKLPVPGAGLLRQWDGWDRLDLSMLMALLLFVAITLIWIRVFTELMDSGSFAERRDRNPLLFYLLAAVIVVVVIGDCSIFYFGLAAKAASSWTDVPAYMPALATTLYMACLALLGAWHADHHTSGAV